MAKVYKTGKITGNSYIAGNSVSVVDGDMVSNVGGFIIKSTSTTGKICGIALGEQTFSASNQTVAKAKLSYMNSSHDVQMTIKADAAIVQTDVGSFFNINDTTQTVDVATKSAAESYVDTVAGTAFDPVIKYQVKLIEFISQDASIYSLV